MTNESWLNSGRGQEIFSSPECPDRHSSYWVQEGPSSEVKWPGCEDDYAPTLRVSGNVSPRHYMSYTGKFAKS